VDKSFKRTVALFHNIRQHGSAKIYREFSRNKRENAGVKVSPNFAAIAGAINGAMYTIF